MDVFTAVIAVVFFAVAFVWSFVEAARLRQKMEVMEIENKFLEHRVKYLRACVDAERQIRP